MGVILKRVSESEISLSQVSSKRPTGLTSLKIASTRLKLRVSFILSCHKQVFRGAFVQGLN
jgi:hypothetical protein